MIRIKRRTAYLTKERLRQHRGTHLVISPSAAQEQHAANDQQADARIEPTGQDPVDYRKLEQLADLLQRARVADYINMSLKPVRMIMTNLIAGMARGFGFAIGFSLLAVLFVNILKALQILDLPVIGQFIADLLEYIDVLRSNKIY